MNKHPIGESINFSTIQRSNKQKTKIYEFGKEKRVLLSRRRHCNCNRADPASFSFGGFAKPANSKFWDLSPVWRGKLSSRIRKKRKRKHDTNVLWVGRRSFVYLNTNWRVRASCRLWAMIINRFNLRSGSHWAWCSENHPRPRVPQNWQWFFFFFFDEKNGLW